MKKIIIMGILYITFILLSSAVTADAQTINSKMNLSENKVYDGDLTVTGGYINLKGYQLHVKGNMVLKGSAEIMINNGELVVDGDLTIAEKADLDTGYSGGKIVVGKDFTVESEKRIVFRSGTLEIKGNFEQKGKEITNFYTDDSHTVILSGTGKQTVSFENPDFNGFGHLEITNKPGNVRFLSDMKGWYLASDITVPDSLTVKGGHLNFNGHNLTIWGDLNVTGDCTVDLSGNRLQVDGDMSIKDTSNLRIYTGEAYISGNLSIEEKADIDTGYNGGTISVGKDFMMDSTERSVFRSGTLEIKGNFEQKGKEITNFYTDDSHTVILSGTGKQTVSFENPDFNGFGHLEITNKPGNVRFLSDMKGWYLASDITVPDSLTVKGGHLNFNGHNLTIWGDLNVTRDCTVDLSGNRLQVDGDMSIKDTSNLRIYTGEVYINGNLSIEEKADADTGYNGGTISVGKDFMIDSKERSAFRSGTLEIKGNFEQKGMQVANFITYSGHTVLLSGTGKQTVSFDNPDDNGFASLEIVKPGDRVVFLTQYIAEKETLIDRSDEIDSIPPEVSFTLPDNEAKHVKTDDKSIKIGFNEAIWPDEEFEKISVVCQGYPPAEITRAINGSVLTLTRSNDWTPQCTYTVTIPARAVKDASDNSFAKAVVFTFVTESGRASEEVQYDVKPADGSTLDYMDFNITWKNATWAVKYKITLQNAEDGKTVFTKELTAASTSVSISRSLLENWHQYKIYVAGVDKNGIQQALGTPTVTISHNYTLGDSGDFVKEIQKRLIGKGYNLDGGVTGKYDAKTKAAVYEFKKDKGLSNKGAASGVVGKDTWNRLISGIWLVKGDKGENVTRLQQMLSIADYPTGNDKKGEFGSGTFNAINKFKDKNKIFNSGDMKGIVGDQVWNLLIKKSALQEPKNFKVTADGRTAVKLTWDKVPGATGYNIYRIIKDQPYVKLSATSNSFKDTGLIPGASYWYAVTAVSGDREGPWSKSLQITLAKLAAPKNLKASTEALDKISLTWNAVSGAAGYYIYRKAENDSYWPSKFFSDTNSFQDTSFQTDVKYYYAVAAADSAGEGKWSNSIRVIPPGSTILDEIDDSANVAAGTIRNIYAINYIDIVCSINEPVRLDNYESLSSVKDLKYTDTLYLSLLVNYTEETDTKSNPVYTKKSVLMTSELNKTDWFLINSYDLSGFSFDFWGNYKPNKIIQSKDRVYVKNLIPGDTLSINADFRYIAFSSEAISTYDSISVNSIPITYNMPEETDELKEIENILLDIADIGKQGIKWCMASGEQLIKMMPSLYGITNAKEVADILKHFIQDQNSIQQEIRIGAGKEGSWDQVGETLYSILLLLIDAGKM